MINRCLYLIVGSVLLATCCQGSDVKFGITINSEEKRLWLDTVVPASSAFGDDVSGFNWWAKLRLFTKPPIWGTALTNIQMRELDWNNVRLEAESGNPAAAYLLAHKLLNGNQLYARAAYWLAQAVERGHGPSENDLGVLVMFGLGVTRDMSRAAELFESSASRGVPMGHLNMGLCRLAGLGCRRSIMQARDHIKMAVNKKLPVAEAILAIHYAVGTSLVSRDVERAYELVLLARAHGADWSFDSNSSGNLYYVSISETEDYLMRLISSNRLRRIQNKLSRITAVYSPPNVTLAEIIELSGPQDSGVVVIGPDVPPSEPDGETP